MRCEINWTRNASGRLSKLPLTASSYHYEGDSPEAILVREGVSADSSSEIPEGLPRPPVPGRWVDDLAEDLSE